MEQNEVVLQYSHNSDDNGECSPTSSCACSYSVLKSVHNLRGQQYEHSTTESVCESLTGLHRPISGEKELHVDRQWYTILSSFSYSLHAFSMLKPYSPLTIGLPLSNLHTSTCTIDCPNTPLKKYNVSQASSATLFNYVTHISSCTSTTRPRLQATWRAEPPLNIMMLIVDISLSSMSKQVNTMHRITLVFTASNSSYE